MGFFSKKPKEMTVEQKRDFIRRKDRIEQLIYTPKMVKKHIQRKYGNLKKTIDYETKKIILEYEGIPPYYETLMEEYENEYEQLFTQLYSSFPCTNNIDFTLLKHLERCEQILKEVK